MELKLFSVKLASASFLAFNRTFMELKHYSSMMYNTSIQLLIAPLWN